MSTLTQAPVAIFQHPLLGPAVSGRAIYAATCKSNASRDIFSDWFRNKQSKLGLVENTDYVESWVNLAGSPRQHIEHTLTIEAARRLAEIIPSRRGMPVVDYLRAYMRNGSTPDYNNPPQLQLDTSPLFASTEAAPDIKPKPETESLSPVQQLLAEVQKLASDEQKRKSEPVQQVEQIKGIEVRLRQLERQVSTILYFFQQSSTALRSLAPAQLPYDTQQGFVDLPNLEPTMRVKLTRLVDGYSAAKTVVHQEVWKNIYGHLSTRFGFDAWQHAQGKKSPNYLDIIEENGHLENLYNIAVELLTLSQR